ncbi:hypothetical protein Droror1_Dr00027264 [Drosera rotundifolia]
MWAPPQKSEKSFLPFKKTLSCFPSWFFVVAPRIFRSSTPCALGLPPLAVVRTRALALDWSLSVQNLQPLFYHQKKPLQSLMHCQCFLKLYASSFALLTLSNSMLI